jgi:hypothetical protein
MTLTCGSPTTSQSSTKIICALLCHVVMNVELTTLRGVMFPPSPFVQSLRVHPFFELTTLRGATRELFFFEQGGGV